MSADSKAAAPRLFTLPPFADNADAWGPSSAAQTPLTVQLSAVPFAPFNKNDRLGRVSDWTQKARGGFGGAFQSRGQPPVTATVASSTVAPGGPAMKDDDEGSFETVDGRAKKGPKAIGQKPRYVPNKRFVTNPNQRGGRGGQRGGQRGGRGGRYNPWNNPADIIPKENSIDPPADWKLAEEIELSSFGKVTLAVQEAKDLVEAGVLEPYNVEYDRVTPKNPKSLMRFENKQFFPTSTSEDPIMLRLIQQKAGTVYGTDTLIALLMASAKSVNSWDIIVKKEGDKIIFDKRPESKIDFWSVNENWNEVMTADKESMNHPANLSVEATCITQNLSQQMLDKEVDTDDLWDLGEPHPFADKVAKGMTPASVGYRYRAFNLGDGIRLVVRAEVNGYIIRNDEKEYLNIKTLNEFDSSLSGKVDWRQKLESQSGAVLATEMKNNGARLHRYAAQVFLAGTDHIRLGFVSRIHTADNYNHSILAAQRYPTALSFAQTLGIEIKTLWGTLRTLIKTIQKLDDGKYVLLKPAASPSLSIYAVPASYGANIGANTVASVAPPAKEEDDEDDTPAASASSAAAAPAPAKEAKEAPKKSNK